MSIRTSMHQEFDLAHWFAAPNCPRCDELQLAPETSEFVRAGRIRHRWSCESCGHSFTTSVRYAAK